MSLQKNLKKAAGLFFEFAPEDESQALTETPVVAAAPVAPTPVITKSVEQIVRETPGPNLDQIKVEAPVEPVIGADGVIHFESIYQLAKIQPAAFGAEQLLDLLNSLPTELPLATKRATVKVTLGAMGTSMGVTSETIVADASRKLAALAAYAKSFETQVTEYTSKAELEIISLEAQIQEKRARIEDAKSKLGSLTQACTVESDRIDDVLEFFSLDVAPSKYADPA
ncbi:MAG: hypothetical protein ACOYON_00385 [Fimbriimonas sp.]